ncbi:MAG: N-6 DNA methylase [Helicobacteraceae bacterium]|jgi:hypothetical protein|nr:N-6 DNA methylase [Helicobacteraceae bacterium]
MKESQNHLNHKQRVDLGSFYTPKDIVGLTSSLLQKNVENITDFSIFDSSCGYGSFLTLKIKAKRFIGADVDKQAIDEAKKTTKDVEFFEGNSLQNVARQNYQITDDEKLIMIGNPPYNDTTSIIRQSIKDKSVQDEIDQDIKTRDLGMSFLLSYDKLKANYICVLHPLSYLIKKANFTSLGKLIKNYKLIDGIIISSHEFSDTSRGMAFPILISLYTRDRSGMNYEYVKNYKFQTKERKTFCLNDFDTIVNYISKYPNKKYISDTSKPVAKFYTMRDINALKRSRTFIENDTANTVYVIMDKLPYYCYVDVFKKYADKLPYYFGNCDVIINHEEFEKIKECFIAESVHNNQILKKQFKFRDIPNAGAKIEEYFNKLLRKHIYAAN